MLVVNHESRRSVLWLWMLEQLVRRDYLGLVLIGQALKAHKNPPLPRFVVSTRSTSCLFSVSKTAPFVVSQDSL